MATFDYNPITGQLDLVGAGSATSYIDGEVEYHSNLPVTAGSPAVNSAFLVRKGEGLYFISRKPAGIWVRELNNGNLDDWKYAGTFSDLYRDSNFRILNNADVSKQLAFNLSGIASGQTRTLTVPNASGTIALAGDKPAFRVIRDELPNIGGSGFVDWFVESDTTGVWPSSTTRNVVSLTREEGQATATVPAHGFSEGQNATISGANESRFNGVIEIGGVETSDTFFYEVAYDDTTDDINETATGSITASVDGFRSFVVPSGFGGLWAFHTSIYFGTSNGNSVTNEISLRVNDNRTAGNYVSSFNGGGGQGQNQVFAILNMQAGDIVTVYSGFFYNGTAYVRSDEGVGWFTGTKL